MGDNLKFDDGKLPIGYVPPKIIEEIADIRAYGVEKYTDPESWRQVIC